MNTILKALSGKKTYIITGATILYCLLGLGLHFMAVPMAISIIGTTGSIAALRIGVSRAQGVLEVILEILKLIGNNEQTTQPIPPAQPVPAPEIPVPPITPTPPAAVGGVAQ